MSGSYTKDPYFFTYFEIIDLSVGSVSQPILRNYMTKSTIQKTPSVELKNYIDRFVVAYKKSAKNVVELATVIGESYANLDEKSFKTFCTNIGYTTRSSYVSKMKTIYTNLGRFQGVKDALPGNYTTIYDLARMPIEQFNHLVANGTVTPTMRAPKVNKDPNQNVQKNGFVVKVKWDSVSMMGLAALTHLLDGFDQKWGCTIVFPEGVRVADISSTQMDTLDVALAANDPVEAIAA